MREPEDNPFERDPPQVIEDAVPIFVAVDPTTDNDPNPKKRKKGKERCHVSKEALEERLYRRAVLCVTKPSYVLGLGSVVVRPENRDRLCRLLGKLVKRHDWAEACGVLAVLMNATRKERSPATNRFKYSVAMELLKHVDGEEMKLSAVSDSYDAWMMRVGYNFSNKRRKTEYSKEESFAVRLEYALFDLLQGQVEAERQEARSLMQEQQGFGNHPVFNLIIGLIFYQLWYSTLPDHLQWKDSDEALCSTNSDLSASPMELDHSAATSIQKVENMEDQDANFSNQYDISIPYDSDSSVRIDKELSVASEREFHKEVAPVNAILSVSDNPQDRPPQGFYVNSGANGASAENDSSHLQFFAEKYALESMEPWLLPLRSRSLELDGIILNDEYRFAVKYLRTALYSSPPTLAALLPLIQLLLIGGECKEALDELENFSGSSSAALPNRLRSNILEHVNPDNRVMLSTSSEEALQSDPTCSQFLATLISLHKEGDYSVESLLEAVSLHLDAAYPPSDTWKELSMCFLKVFQSEEDRMSACLHGDVGAQKQFFSVRYNRIPRLFTHGKSGEAWKLRWKWWSKRHFSTVMVASEIASGDLQLTTYKAACASHMYGPVSEYVMKVYSCLEKEHNEDLLMFLQLHMHNSVGLHLKYEQRTH